MARALLDYVILYAQCEWRENKTPRTNDKKKIIPHFKIYENYDNVCGLVVF